MPRRTDLKTILIIGSGPIVIGQACEFDYSGTQACRVLKQDGFRVVLVNSNPATIMTDPEVAEATYVEPLVPEVVEQIIAKERPQALLPTLGGQTGLNLAVALAEAGVLDRYGVELIGAKLPSIKLCEDRLLFKEAMCKVGLDLPRSDLATSLTQAEKIAHTIGFPVVIRPSFTLGGTGGGIAYNLTELRQIVSLGLELSPAHSVLIEESVDGWKEYELEVMRDSADQCVIVCSIENLDPMGIHTGDSITVAPAQTLTDKEYQRMRDAALLIMRTVGVDTGGSNIQFAVEPQSGRMVVIEMNPRVSRSSALASKATGFPIAKIAAKLAVGYTLEEIPNDITRKTPACFEPSIDYVVVKVPRFTFDKFPEADPVLTTQMKSVGEAMAFGRTFREALQKAFRSTEAGYTGLIPCENGNLTLDQLREKLARPHFERLQHLVQAFAAGLSVDEAFRLTKIDSWFLNQIKSIVELDQRLAKTGQTGDLFRPGLNGVGPELLGQAKASGFSDIHIGARLGLSEERVRALCRKWGLQPVFKAVDTCAGEFEAYTPYFYSTYEEEDEIPHSTKSKVIILGSGPNRIGQGIEFDYACVHAVLATKEAGYEAILVNCNPETVSTDYDVADRLYFEPITREDVLNIVEKEKPYGVLIGFGGQTPLKLALPLLKAGVPILGTQPQTIDLAEDRRKFSRFLEALGIPQPQAGFATSLARAFQVAQQIGYPVLVRPSYVLGGQAMQVVFSPADLEAYLKQAWEVSPEHPVLIDKFLEDAIEVDVDAVADGKTCFIGGIMEHIEEAGIHSGDSSCVLPPFSLSDGQIATVADYTRRIALSLDVVGLLNIQFAIKDRTVYVLEANPRASRTVPFVSKATGIPLAKVATKVALGRTLRELNLSSASPIAPPHFAVKMPVFPFIKFPGADYLLGPQMKSTGEVMGLDVDLGAALLKAELAVYQKLPAAGKVFVSVKNKDKRLIGPLVRQLSALGFQLVATQGTARALAASGLAVETIAKLSEGRPNVVDMIKSGQIQIVINTPEGFVSQRDTAAIRRAALERGIPLVTTLSGTQMLVNALERLKQGKIEVRSLQEYFAPREKSEFTTVVREPIQTGE